MIHRGSFFGRDEGAARAEALLARVPPRAGRMPVVVGDNYLVAGKLELRLRGRADVFVLDHPRNHTDGRALQYELWGTGERGLRGRAGEDALVVVERSAIRDRHFAAWLDHVGGLFEALEPLGEFKIRAGGTTRRFLFFAGRSVRAT
jgi:hypothetical protein